MRSAKIHPESYPVCGPPAAARTRRGQSDCASHRQRHPGYTADKVRRLCEMKEFFFNKNYKQLSLKIESRKPKVSRKKKKGKTLGEKQRSAAFWLQHSLCTWCL